MVVRCTLSRKRPLCRAFSRLLGNCRAFLDPLADFGDEFRVSEGGPRAASGGTPAGQDKRILCNVMDDLFQRPAAVTLGVFQLARQFGGVFALKHHWHVRGREMPFGMARRHVFAGKVVVLMAIPALESVKELPSGQQ